MDNNISSTLETIGSANGETEILVDSSWLSNNILIITVSIIFILLLIFLYFKYKK